MTTTSLGFDNYYETTLSSSCGSGDTTLSINTAPTATEGYLVVEPDNATTREIVYYTGKTASSLTGVTRGQGGTTAQAHASGSTVRSNVVAEHLEALQDGTAIATGAITSSKIPTDAIILAYAETTTGQSFATTGPVDATTMTVTFTTPLGCTKLLLRAEATISCDTATTTNTVYITDSSNVIQVKRDIITGQANVSALQSISLSRRITVSANTSYTFKMRVGNSANTTVLNQGNSADRPTCLWVERA